MRSKTTICRFLVLLLSMTSIVRSQVINSARQGNSLFTFGAGASQVFVSDWGPGGGRLLGITGWVNIHPQMPRRLDGLSIEIEGRDASFGRHNLPSNFRLDSIGGGPVYTLSRFQNFRPYGKFLISYGSADFTVVGYPNYHHDTTMVSSPGAGFEYRAYQSLSVRADYEYQFWTRLWNMTPQALTVGVSYNMQPFHQRQ